MSSCYNWYNAWIISLTYFTLACFSNPISFSPLSLLHPNGIASDVNLRILPLGDSITYGQGSSDGNGYRLRLHTLLSPRHNVEYIGQERDGSMNNNHHEGHKGFPIGPVGITGKRNYADRPNIVLLMAGTNDVVFQMNLENAPNVLGQVIDEILAACPDAVVLVATLTPLLDANREARKVAFNAALPDMIDQRTKMGKHVLLVDMSRVTKEHINATDGIHPTEGGYQLIAGAWYDGIVAVGKKGWIGAPITPPVEGDVAEDGEPPMGTAPVDARFETSSQLLWVVAGVFVVGFAIQRVLRSSRWKRRYDWPLS
ncbi:uncharacterized protein PADG_06769 [Paracoccidioides brasiliensis Pb18]|uniref:SGNH hydrolase-type esterase domain-containing protein n=1 Tax=Paracoccidioides brasiliensis (strain Pb18) TaxID=502780 RepID=C1GHN3_PARBD|nr:uncharacterized protein PADG_06769 [Paracoccidioides brasiliensis Pb18]EEH50690.1 hypothetical protein PADG_06769 [Paracoccidioides brasiliensis Pb18]